MNALRMMILDGYMQLENFSLVEMRGSDHKAQASIKSANITIDGDGNTGYKHQL
jgi:hypothetical protein